MDRELLRVDRLVKRFDRDLEARRSIHGTIQVCQRTRTWVPHEVDGKTILYAQDDLHAVFGLTKNWSVTGEPVIWGYEPLRAKMNEISLERRDELRRLLQKEREQLDESKRRDRLNMFESIADETRVVYKEAFKDINTATMDKKKDPRRKFDRRMKYGNR